MSNSILIEPEDEDYKVTIDGRMFHVKPGEPLHKMAQDLLRLRRLAGSSNVKFPEYTLEQLEEAMNDGRGDEEIAREIARRKGVIYFPINPDRRNIK